jgi:hypothetical protein
VRLHVLSDLHLEFAPFEPPAAAADADRTQLIDTSKPLPEAPNAGAVRGGVKNTRGTMFGQLYSPFAITQEVVKKPGPKP